MANIYDIELLNSILNPKTPVLGENLYDPLGRKLLASTIRPVQEYSSKLSPLNLMPTSDYPEYVETDIGATGTVPELATGIMQQAQDFEFLPSANESDLGYFYDANRNLYDSDDQKPKGIAKLFEFLQNIPTPFNLARRGLESLRGVNQKLRGSTFALSPTLNDYFKAKRMEKKAAIGADRPGDGGDCGSRRGDADIAGKDRGSFQTDDTAGFFQWLKILH